MKLAADQASFSLMFGMASLDGWSATLTLRDYGRVARDPGGMVRGISAFQKSAISSTKQLASQVARVLVSHKPFSARNAFRQRQELLKLFRPGSYKDAVAIED